MPNLFRLLRVLLCVVAILLATRMFAETRALPTLSVRDAVGAWEAVAPDGVFSVYLMTISAEGNAELIELSVGKDKSPLSYFIGHASSYEFSGGKFKARFEAFPEHVRYLDWIEVQGEGIGEGDVGTIAGKITKHRTGTTLDEWSVPAVFNKGDWLERLHTAAQTARAILRDPDFDQFHHAIPKKSASER
jgi:hypothetical protein